MVYCSIKPTENLSLLFLHPKPTPILAPIKALPPREGTINLYEFKALGAFGGSGVWVKGAWVLVNQGVGFNLGCRV